MGVLGDDDIEKLNQSFKIRKIPKRFYDPVKAYNAYDIAVTVAGGAIFLAAFLWVFGDFLMNDLRSDIDLLKEHVNSATNRVVDLQDLIIDNADCPSLFKMYSESRENPTLDYTKDLIKDEIAFRCK